MRLTRHALGRCVRSSVPTNFFLRTPPLYVNDDFDVLFGFFKDHEHEVAGRSAPVIPPDLREKISRFAAGQSTEEERAEMKRVLQEEPALIPVLVGEVEAMRRGEQ